MNFFRKEVKIGLVAVAGLVVLFFGLQFLKGLTLFGNDDNYYITFDDINGLSVSSPIYANGFKVGVVKDIIYNYKDQSKIVAVMGLDNQMQLPVGSTAEISSDLMGNIKVNLRLGPNPASILHLGDTITGGMEQGLMAKAGEMVPQIAQILPKLDSIMASLNALLADPAIAQSLHNVETITNNLKTSTNELNGMMTQMNRRLPGMLAKADTVLSNTNTLTHNLSAIDVATTMAKVDATLANVQQMTEKLNSNEGTLGLMMRDPSLYNNLSSTAAHADSLLIDLRAHPKRYVHFSVFGK